MKKKACLALGIILAMTWSAVATAQTVDLSGELRTWHKISLDVVGPSVSETDAGNPFLNYKVTGIFTQGTNTFSVPGYFAADGDAANTGASSGSVWKIHFTPPTAGTWEYTIRFRSGSNVAINDDILAGDPVLPADNSAGSFLVLESNKISPDLRAKGRLQYVGEHYLRFAGNGEWFIKAGPDSPENLLACEDIDNTPNNGGLRKTWSAHVKDWSTGDPTWKDGKGKGIIGALNYLSAKGMNTISFLSMNIQGDDKNVFPYLSSSNLSRLDCSKLDQWEIIFAHAEKRGIHLHFKLQETENELVLDNGALGTNRKLYYRELIARFGHHLAISWNLGEESGAGFSNTNQTDAQRIACSRYFESTDPYRHNVDIHTGGSTTEHDKIYTPLLGDKSAVTGASMQGWYGSSHSITLTWVKNSAAAGKKWVVAHDEQGGADHGVPEDAYVGDVDKHDIRKKTLWGNLMAGGGGVEYYFGYQRPHSDLNCQDFRYRDESWGYCKHALDFFNIYLPYWEMTNMDNISSAGSAFVLGKAGEVYAVYLPSSGLSTLDLPAGNYAVKWYNPREGRGLIEGTVTEIAGGTNVSIGTPPDGNDWVALVREGEFSHEGNQVTYVPCAGDPEVLTSYNDFPLISGIEGFVPAYKDNTRQCLAVDATQYKDEFAAARTIYTGPSGLYNVKINTFLEYDGESTYRLKIDDVPVGEFQNPRTDEAGDMSLADTTWTEIYIETGALIQVEFDTHSNGLIAEGSGWAYSRGRWKSLEIIPLCAGAPGITDPDDPGNGGESFSQLWIEKDGILVVDVESLEGFEEKNWTLNQGNSHMGSGFLQYLGANSLGAELEENRLVYRVQISTPGDYEFIFRVKQPSDATAGDAWNDSWVNIKADNYFGIPAGQSFATGTRHSLNRPIKSWIQNRASESFTWKTNGDYQYNGSHYNGTKLGCTFNAPGIYEVHISGRSKFHTVDRFALAMDGKQSAATSQVEESQIISSGPIVLLESLEADHSELGLMTGESATIGLTFTPSNATNKEVSWTSSDPGIASVSEGVILGVSPGVAAITVRSSENGSISQVITLQVISPEVVSEIIYDPSGIIAYYADSEDDEVGMAFKENAVDGDLGSMWHTQWSTAKPPHDHEIRFNLGSSLPLDRLTYYPRQDLVANGTVGSYEIYVSDDSTDFGTAVTSGTFTWPEGLYKDPKTIELVPTVSGQFVRFVAKDEIQSPDNPWTSMAELVFKADFQGVKISSESEKLGIGESLDLTASILPYNDVETYPITWSSSNESCVSVDGGSITGNEEGMAYVVASILEGAYADTCIVAVSAGDTLIAFPESSLELLVGAGRQLQVLMIPEAYAVSWSSNNPAVADVDVQGMLSCYSNGSATITASILQGRYSANLEVNVVNAALDFDLEKDTLLLGNSASVSYQLSPSDSVITWKSTNPEVASVTMGIMVARSRGDVKIIASSIGGAVSDTLDLHVFEPYVSFISNEQEILLGQELRMMPSVFPDTSTLSWSSDDPEIASVSDEGLVKAHERGTTLITASIKGGMFRALCVMEVIQPGLQLSADKKEVQVGTSVLLTANPSPDTCMVSWSSDAPGIASVNENGIIEGHAAGSATVTASILGGTAKAECVVTVYEPSIAFLQDSEILVLKDSRSMQVAVVPQGENMKWSSLDNEIVSIENGVITGMKLGSTEVSVSILGDSYSDTCEITVIEPEVSISSTEAEVYLAKIISLEASVNSSGMEIEWLSSAPEVASVSRGNVKGLSPGTSIITAQVEDGAYFAQCELTVLNPVVDISEDSVTMLVSESYELHFSVGPEDSQVSWTSDDPSVASVSNGVLSANAAGSCKIVASIYYGYFTDTCVVTVSSAVGMEDLHAGSLQLYPNPTSGILFIRGAENLVRIEVLNIGGQLLIQKNAESRTIDLSLLEKGIYFVRMTGVDDKQIMRKVLLK